MATEPLRVGDLVPLCSIVGCHRAPVAAWHMGATLRSCPVHLPALSRTLGVRPEVGFWKKGAGC